MSKIWKEQNGVSNHPKRNNFDLSFQNHLSMKLGTLYPILCKPVVPGDSFNIKTAFGLKFMPMVFPIQSKMMAYVHYFYVRNKNIWKNWENFISGLEEHTHPYIAQPASFFKTGSLSDYLGVPTTVMRPSGTKQIIGNSHHNFISSNAVGDHSNTHVVDFGDSVGISVNRNDVGVEYHGLSPLGLNHDLVVGDSLGSRVFYLYGQDTQPSWGLYLVDHHLQPLADPEFCNFSFGTTANLSSLSPAACQLVFLSYTRYPLGDFNLVGRYADFGSGATIPTLPMATLDNDWGHMQCRQVVSGTLEYGSDNVVRFSPSSSQALAEACNAVRSMQDIGVNFMVGIQWRYTFDAQTGANTSPFPLPHQMATKTNNIGFDGNVIYNIKYDTIEENADVYDDSEGDISLNALPYRAYESIYWSYYANTQNQPFYVNGDPVYNRYNTTLEDGADTTNYHLFQRNYELDYLTSAMPSPQFGNAPLVGLNAIEGDIQLEDESIAHYTADLDGNGSICKLVFSSADGQEVAVADIPKLGFTINDFRGANALQNFLEMTLRHGYRYRDFIQGHFGSAPKDQELDMPEFLGGVSQQVIVNQITNMAKTDSNALGEMGGVANCFGMSKHDVRRYFDDYGYIVGIMCVVPEPAYSQLLPKHFLHNSQLDYFFPEFSQLGLQPITYQEVCPNQVFEENGNLMDTFGYQRPNYDLVSYTNELHGEFRQSLHNFLFNRQFVNIPQLGTDFLEINPAELNDVFVRTTSDKDTIIGQVVLDIKAKRPIPRVSIPSLGR